MRYYKKPDIVDAVLYDGTEKSYEELRGTFKEVKFDLCGEGFLQVGNINIAPGEYVIRNIYGTLCNIKSEIFEAVYDPEITDNPGSA